MQNKTQISELTTYIKRNLKKGYTKDSLKVALKNQKYSKFEIDKALKRAEQELAIRAESKSQILNQEIDALAENIPISEKKPSFWSRFFTK